MTMQSIPPMKEEQTSTPVIDDNQLPAYTAEDESVVMVADGEPASPLDPSPSYPTAEEEKARLGRSLGDVEAGVFCDAETTAVRQQVSDGPGVVHAQATTLSHGLQVPTFSRFVSSGFPYPDVLAGYQVMPADWAQFTSEITAAARMNADDWAFAIGVGAGTAIIAGIAIGWWGIIPAYFAGRRMHWSREAKNVAKARNTGDLEQKLLKWNQDFFAPRGFLIRLDLPGESYDIGKMDVHANRRSADCCKASKYNSHALDGLMSEKKLAKMQQKMERKMEKKAKKAVKTEAKIREKAVKKGRIVILPLTRDGNPLAPTTTSSPIPSVVDATVVPDLARLSVSEKATEAGDLYAASAV